MLALLIPGVGMGGGSVAAPVEEPDAIWIAANYGKTWTANSGSLTWIAANYATLWIATTD